MHASVWWRGCVVALVKQGNLQVPEAFCLSNGGKLVFSRLTNKENVLVSYDDEDVVNELTHTFLTEGIRNGCKCFYACNEKSNKIASSWLNAHGISFCALGKRDTTTKLSDAITEFYDATESEGLNTRVLVNWGGGARASQQINADSIEYFIKELPSLQRQPWKRKFEAQGVDTRHLNVDIVDGSSLDEDSFNKLAELHHKIFFTSKKTQFASFSVRSPTSHRKSTPLVRHVNEEAMEKSVKANLEVAVLSQLLQAGPACGYDVIKRIYRNFHVMVPQGTVYSLLYSMEKNGILEAENTRKAKIYKLTQLGQKNAVQKIGHCTSACGYMLSILNPPG